jgi:hypothetical protein
MPGPAFPIRMVSAPCLAAKLATLRLRSAVDRGTHQAGRLIVLSALLRAHTLTLRLICQSSASDQAPKPTIRCCRSLTVDTRVLG